MSLYSGTELTQELQSFTAEHEAIAAGKFRCPVGSFNMRALVLGHLFTINAYILVTYDLCTCATELSHWGLWLTTLWVAISLKCSVDSEISSKWLVANHILFEIITPMNLLITVVYWHMLRDVALATYANTPSKAMHSTLLHTAPLLSTGINFMVTDIVIKASHGLFLFPIAIVYGILNYQATMTSGKPVYHFLPWETDFNSAL